MIGETHGHYHITGRLGAGGMGEVYRATDTRLKRDVAVKVLPDEVAQDPERLTRLQREAELLASLNHPNIAAIHGLEEANGKPLLILELVEGEDLSERLGRGRLPLGDALEIARQIAEALEEAHRRGIVHRDLKPSNVKLAPDGRVKVLDFGLAKARAGDGAGESSADLSQSPTLAHSGTQPGVLLGTAAYMSPEQARGKVVDERTDLWAFGAVLFEMLAGAPLFAGETVTDLLAAVVREPPDWGRLSPETPGSVRRLLERCLARDVRRRLRNAGDAALELDESATSEMQGVDPQSRRRVGPRLVLAGGLALLAAGIAGLALGWHLSSDPTRGPLQLSIPVAPAVELVSRFAISPDGTRVAFSARDEDGSQSLYVRALDEPLARRLPGTEFGRFPFFSPDGEWIAFCTSRPADALKKVPTTGGPVVTLAEGNFRGSRGTWTEDGWILMNSNPTAGSGDILRVRSDGGSLEPLKTSGGETGKPARTVSKIPGSQALLLTVSPESPESPEAAVAIQSLETGERRVLVPGGSWPRYLASGHVLYTHSGELIASRLDVAAMRLVGTPVPLLDVTGPGGVASFDVSQGGRLVFSSLDEGRPGQLAWIARDGRTTPVASAMVRGDPRLSPDGTRVALSQEGEVWVLDLGRGTTARISAAAGEDETGTWSPDGRWIAWAAQRPGENRAVLRRRADGSGGEERLWSDERHFHVASWSPVGIVVTVQDPITGGDVLLLDPEGASEARPLLDTSFDEQMARVSPDGGLLAYVSDETGRAEVYVQSFPGPRPRVQVSVGGGTQPVWRPGTREIVYRGSGQLMSVTLGPGDPATVTAPRALFEDTLNGLAAADHTHYAVDRDGRLLAFEEPEHSPSRQIRVVFDWMEAAGLLP